MNIHIDFNWLPHSEAVEQHIRERVEKLERDHADIVACHVCIEPSPRGRAHERPYSLRISLTVPDGEIVSTCDRDVGIYVALRDALEASERQLEAYARRRHGELKHLAHQQHTESKSRAPQERALAR